MVSKKTTRLDSPKNNNNKNCKSINTLRFHADEENCDIIYVDMNSEYVYTVLKVPGRLHWWQLLNKDQTPLANLRAARTCSRLEILDNEGIKQKIKPKLCWGLGIMDWDLGNGKAFRWRGVDQSLVRVRGKEVLLPEIMRLDNIPSSGWWYTEDLEFSFSYRKDLFESNELLILVCTAFIAVWKWSKGSLYSEKMKKHIGDPIKFWLARNTKIDQLPEIIADLAKHRQAGAHYL